ncbi:MAG: LysR family transcriptional regulator, partial [Pyrinomonadaceae bacterium]
LTPQTLFGEISQLEETLAVSLFQRAGRLELTETGRDENFQVVLGAHSFYQLPLWHEKMDTAHR